MNPLSIAGLVLALAAWGGSCWKAYTLGQEHELATQAREDKAAQQTREVASLAAADAISQIEVKHVEIRQQLQTTVREVPVYRDCRHDPAGLQRLNAALTEPGAEPAGSGQLPAASAPRR